MKPIIEYLMGNYYTKTWYNEDNEIHRLNEPAKIWYTDKQIIYCKQWFNNGEIHRLYGPAEINYYDDGTMEKIKWFINGYLIDPPFDNYPLSNEQQIEMKLKYL